MGLFDLTVTSSNKRSVDLTPRFSTTTSKGGIKINEAASKLAGIKSGEHIVFVTNFNELQALLLRKPEDNEDYQHILNWAEENDAKPEDYPADWYITEGWELFSTDGTPKLVPERLTIAQKKQYVEQGKVDDEGKAVPELVQDFKGSKMTSQNGSAGYGILQGSDVSNWAALGGSVDEIAEYEVSTDGIAFEIDDKEVTIYKLVNKSTKEKIIRG